MLLEADEEHGLAALGFFGIMVLFANSNQGINPRLLNNSVAILAISIYMLSTTFSIILY